MATDGTIESGLFQTVLEQYGIKCVLPEQMMQNNRRKSSIAVSDADAV